MKRNLAIALTLLVVVLGGVTAYALLNKSDDDKPAAPTSQVDTSEQTVIKVGTIECLPLSTTDGAQNTSCAIGLKQDEETAYALQSSDPTLTGSIPTGQRVQVTGTLVQNTSNVNSSQVINVTGIERL